MSIADFMLGGQSAASGWGRAGAALGDAMSGGGSSQKAYDEAMLRGHRVQKALMDARKATQEYNAAFDLHDALTQALPPEQHNLVRYITQAQIAGVNPQQGFQAARESQRNAAMAAAREKFSAGDIMGGNLEMAAASQQPAKVAQVQGNVVFNPLAPANAQTPQLTEYGAGQLANSADRVAGQNAAAMVRATAPRATGSSTRGGGDPAARKEYDAQMKAAAQDILTGAKLAGNDVQGLSLADIMSQMANGGVVRDMEGKQIGNWDVDFESFANPKPQPDFSNVMSGSAPTVSTGAPGAPVTEPKGAPRVPTAAGAAATPATLPAAALAQLSEGEVTTFANGQSWTLRNGTPVRVN